MSVGASKLATPNVVRYRKRLRWPLRPARQGGPSKSCDPTAEAGQVFTINRANRQWFVTAAHVVHGVDPASISVVRPDGASFNQLELMPIKPTCRCGRAFHVPKATDSEYLTRDDSLGYPISARMFTSSAFRWAGASKMMVSGCLS